MLSYNNSVCLNLIMETWLKCWMLISWRLCRQSNTVNTISITQQKHLIYQTVRLYIFKRYKMTAEVRKCADVIYLRDANTPNLSTWLMLLAWHQGCLPNSSVGFWTTTVVLYLIVFTVVLEFSWDLLTAKLRQNITELLLDLPTASATQTDWLKLRHL